MVRQACPELAEGLTTNETQPVPPEPVEGRLPRFEIFAQGLGLEQQPQGLSNLLGGIQPVLSSGGLARRPNQDRNPA